MNERPGRGCKILVRVVCGVGGGGPSIDGPGEVGELCGDGVGDPSGGLVFGVGSSGGGGLGDGKGGLWRRDGRDRFACITMGKYRLKDKCLSNVADGHRERHMSSDPL